MVVKDAPVFLVQPQSTLTRQRSGPGKQDRVPDIPSLDGEVTPPMLRIGWPLIIMSAMMGMAPVQPCSANAEVAPKKAAAFGTPKVHVFCRSVWLEIYSIAILGGVTYSSYMVFKMSGDESLKLNKLANVLIYASGLMTVSGGARDGSILRGFIISRILTPRKLEAEGDFIYFEQSLYLQNRPAFAPNAAPMHPDPL